MTIEKVNRTAKRNILLESPYINQIFEAAQKSILIDAESGPAKGKLNRNTFKLKVAQHMISDLESERQDLEAQLRLLQAAVEYSNDGISISDMCSPDNRIIYVSPKLEELTGYSADELIGQNWRKLYKNEPDTEARELLRNALDAGLECTASVRNIKKDGTPLLSKVTLRPLRNSAGEVTHYVSVIQDESEKLKTDEVLRNAQRLDSIGLMAGGIAHDFNNILQGILTQVSIAMRKLQENDPARKNIDAIQRAGKRAADLTHRLLRYAKEEEFDIEELNIKELVDESVSLVASTISPKIKLCTSIHDELADIQTVKGQAQQILINLILNAADSIREEGFINVSSRGVEKEEFNNPAGLTGNGYLSNGLNPEQNYVVIDVADTGCGMDLQTLKKIFNPFFTTKEAGNGLGLAVTLGAVQAQKGALKVESQLGIGSQFSIYFPAKRN